MTANQMGKILFTIQASYPRDYARMGQDELKDMMKLWLAFFSGYSYEAVMGGVQAFIASDAKGFPPVPGQIIDKIHYISSRENGFLNEYEAWTCVAKAIGNSTYHSREEFEKLPPLVQKAVGSPEVLRGLAMSDISVIDTVEKSNFLRTYRNLLERQRLDDVIPDGARAMITKTADKMSIEDNDAGNILKITDRKNPDGTEYAIE